MEPPKGYRYGYRAGWPLYKHIVRAEPHENRALCGTHLDPSGYTDQIKDAEGVRFCKKCLRICSDQVDPAP